MNKLEYIAAYRHFCRNGEKIRISWITLRQGYDDFEGRYVLRNEKSPVSIGLVCDKKEAFRKFYAMVMKFFS